MRIVIMFLVTLLLSSASVNGQEAGFDFGRITLREMDMTSYPQDTSAAAVILQEFGSAHIDSDEFDLQFEYHVKIKILKQTGVEYGDVELYLHRQNGKEEVIKSFEASSFNMQNGRIVESKMQTRDIFRQEVSDYTVVQRYAIPNVAIGSVIEYKYRMESPWLSNFHPWEFQTEIPKVSSEFWALIPPYYAYTIALKGFLKLSKNESQIVPSCFSSGAGTVDCTRFKYAMKDIPAFTREKYMTASSNYLSTLQFELQEIHHPDGRVDKITTEWKDAVDELRRENRFGVQLKRAKNLVGDDVAVVTAGVTDPLEKAKLIYDFVKRQFQWNGVYGKYSEHGIRKALDLRVGNVGDINLTLVAALLAADLNAEPVILSTRENGFAIEVRPVLTDYNYVIARLTVGDKIYLLDATDDFMPFGLIPERCVNGKGRVIAEKSDWQQLDAPASRKTVTVMNLKILPDGKMTGHLEINYYNYEAVDERKRISEINDDQKYVAKKTGDALLASVTNIVKENALEIDKPLTVKFDFEGDLFDPTTASTFLLNPFLINAWKQNPFKSAERLFPVDFGIPIDERNIVYLELPGGYQLKSAPEKVGLALPNSGGRYIYQSKIEGNKISISNNLVISRTLYTAQEYHYLKELFARLLQTQGADLVIEKL